MSVNSKINVRSHRKFNEAELKFIIENSRRISVKEIAIELQRSSERGIRGKIQKLGIKLADLQRSGRIWTAEEIETLKTDLLTSNRELADRFGRSVTSIAGKKCEIGIIKPKKQMREKEMVERYQQGESATSIAKSMGLFTSTVSRILKRNKLRVGYKKGSEHPMWKGGKVKKTGYWAIWNPTHPRANNVGYVKEHILVLEALLGRTIGKKEIIHHIDFNRLNNEPDNLWLTSSKYHHIAETSIYKLIKGFLDDGYINFDRPSGTYIRVN